MTSPQPNAIATESSGANELLRFSEAVFAHHGAATDGSRPARHRLLEAGAFDAGISDGVRLVRAMRSLGFEVRPVDPTVPPSMYIERGDAIVWGGFNGQTGRSTAFVRIGASRSERWTFDGGPPQTMGRTKVRRETPEVTEAWVVGKVMAAPPHAKSLSPWMRVWRLIRWDKGDMMSLIMFAAFIGILSLGTPLASQALVGSIAFGTNLQMVVVLAVVLLIAMVVSASLQALEIRVAESMQQRMLLRVMARLSSTLPRLGKFGLGTHGPSLVGRFYDVFTIQKSVTWLFLEGLRLAISAIVGMVLLATYHPILLAFDLVVLLFVLLVLFGLGRRGLYTAENESTAKHHLFDGLHEVVSTSEHYHGVDAVESVRARLDHAARHWLVERRRQFTIVYAQAVGALLLQALTLSLLLALGGYLVIKGQLTLGQLVAAELAVAAIVYPVAKIGLYVETVYDLYAAAYKLGRLTDVEPHSSGLSVWPAETRRQPARVNIVDPVLETPAGRCHWVRGTDLRIEGGSRVLLRGHEASGKSLLMATVSGLVPVLGGRVEVDGYDVRELDNDELRQDVFLVSRATVTHGDLLENVRVGRPWVTHQTVRQLLLDFGCEPLLSRLNPGEHRPLEPWLGSLSDTETVLVSLARAMVGGPRLLLLDGVLDQLPPSYRERVCRQLFRSDAPWTLIVTTHDPAIAAMCTQTFELVR